MGTIFDIWPGVVRGQSSCWRELVEQYEALVFTVARRAGLSRGEAQDCSQHVWLSLFRTRHTIKDPGAIPAWLIRSAHRRAVRMVRQRHRAEPLDSERPTAGGERLPDEVVIALERQAHVELALSRLEPRCRQMLVALFYSDEAKSYADIARELGIPANSFGPTRLRCLRKLRKIIEELGYRQY